MTAPRILRRCLLAFLVLGAGIPPARSRPPVSQVHVRDGVPRLLVHARETPPLLFFTSPPSDVHLDKGGLLLDQRHGEATTFVPGPFHEPLAVEGTLTMDRGYITDGTAQIRVWWDRRKDIAYIIGLQYVKHGPHRIKLWKRNRRGRWETWHTVPWEWKMGTPIRLRIEVAPDGRVRGFADGRLVAVHHDPHPLDPGDVGIGAYCCRAHFQTVRIEAPERALSTDFRAAGNLPAPWSRTDSTVRMQSFARAGIRLFTWGVPAALWWKPDGTVDVRPIEAQVRAMTRAVPRGMVLLRMSVNPPAWWLAKHPDDRSVLQNRDGRKWSPNWAAMGSEAWREEAGRAFARCVEQLTNGPVADDILGWHVAGGDCGEWSYAWGEACADYSPAQLQAFRTWLRLRYDNDTAIQQAWGRPDVTLSSALIPGPRRRYTAAIGELRDPHKEQDVIDYLLFHSQACADALCHFCRIARNASGARYITGGFYGYLLTAGWRAASWHDSGHHALQRVLDSPFVDFICDPYNYRNRGPGAPWTSQAPAAAIAISGKLHLSEDDTRTFLTPDDPGHAFGRCPDYSTTVGVLKRNWAAVVTRGGGLWWMEQGPGWFEDPSLLREIRNMQDVTRQLAPPACRSAAEVAVVIDETSGAVMAQTTNVLLPLLVDQVVGELGRAGVPYDVILASQLHAARGYRFYIFPLLYAPPAEVRNAIRGLYAPNRTFLWLHAPGLVTPDGPSAEASSRLVGIRFVLRKIGGPVHVTLGPPAHRRWPRLPQDLRYGALTRISPILEARDPEAEILGIGRATSLDVLDGKYWPRATWQGPGLAEKEVNGAHVFFSAAGPLPACMLREMFREAGVHIWNETGDWIAASRGMVALHAAYTGKHSVLLPEPMRVTSHSAEDDVPESPTKRITCVMGSGDTSVWRTRPAAR